MTQYAKIKKKYQLAYFVSHPIHYQAPLLKEISNHPDIDLTVYFQSDFTLNEYWDEGFQTKVNWDIKLLDGYKYKFLKTLTANNKTGFFSPIVSGVYSALKCKKWDAVWFHGYNHYSILWALFLCKILNIPFFMRMESNLNFSPKGKWFKDKFIKYLIRNASGLLCIGKSNEDYYLSYGANKEILFSMPYTVDNIFFQNLSNNEKKNIHFEKKKLGLNEEYPIILYASKLLKRKNPLKLLESFSSLSNDNNPPRAYLLFIGEGHEKEILQKKIKQLNLENNVKLLGFKNQSELPLYFTMCDVFVLPSQQEPYGLVINEVLNCAKPVITTTEVGCVKDLIVHNVNGFIYEFNNINDLTKYIKYFIKNRDLSKIMGQKSLDKINNWSFAQSVDGIYKALKSL